MKIYKQRSLTARSKFFSRRIVNYSNSLPCHVVEVIYLPGNLPGVATPGRVAFSGALGLGGHYACMKKPFRFCLNFVSLFFIEFRLQADSVSSSSEFQWSTILSEKKYFLISNLHQIFFSFS